MRPKAVVKNKQPTNQVESDDENDTHSTESPVDSEVYDSEDYEENSQEEEGNDDDDDNEGESVDDDEDDDNEEESDDDDGDDDDDDFEKQSSSDESDAYSENSDEDPVDAKKTELLRKMESKVRNYRESQQKESKSPSNGNGEQSTKELSSLLNTDDLSSDDEDGNNKNTIGRVPLHWYDAYDHIGYDIGGDKLVKRKGKDRIDQALENRDNPTALRTVYDMYNDREVILSERDIELIQRIQAGTYAHAEHDDTPDYVDYFSSIKEIMPLSARPLPKSKFLPSKWEMLKVKKILKAMKDGTYKTIAQREEEKRAANESNLYMIWQDNQDDNDIENNKRLQYHLPAPKMPLPGHAESYNPPGEYLLTAEEQQNMDEQDPADRPYNFLPHKFDCLRHVPGYENFVKERFERCLDLYLCPRKLKMRLNIDPETLLPRLPKPKELKPYPNTLMLQYIGHTDIIRSIAVSPDGQYLVSCSDDCTVRLWEVDTCLCRYIWTFNTPVIQVSWNPNYNHHIVAAITDKEVIFITTGTGDRDSTEITDSLLESVRDMANKNKDKYNSGSNGKISKNHNSEDSDDDSDDNDYDDGNKKTNDIEDEVDIDEDDEQGVIKKKMKIKVKWLLSPPNSVKPPLKHGFPIGPQYRLKLSEPISYFAWHYKGDYFGTISSQADAGSVCIHQLSKGTTQTPFSKAPGKVQAISFHPTRPYLFVATQQHVKIYHLIEQKLVKKLVSGCKWISSIDIHPSGDHVIIGSYDRRLVWFDLDLSSTPYKTLKFHEKALRNVRYHHRYPLMASSSDDGSVHIFHSTVYSDLSRSPMIIPLKVLKGHTVTNGIGVLSIIFHPRHPWIFSCGADHMINLYQDI